VNEEKLIQYWSVWSGGIRCHQTRGTYSAGELRDITNAYMLQLKHIGVQPGDTIGLVLANTVAFTICLLACLQLKANPLLLHASTTEDEVLRLQNSIQIKWLLFNRLSSNRITDKFANQVITLSIQDLEVFCCALEAGIATPTPEQGVILHLTSGTYGLPLLCIRNQEVAIAEAINYVSAISPYNRIRIRVTTPLNHAFAYGFGLMSTIITNSVIILDPEFNPKRILKEETKETSDILCVVPPMLKSLIHLKRNNSQYTLPPIVFFAGMGCSPSLADEFERAFGSHLYAILGTTETGSIASSYNHGVKGAGVGKVLPNVKVELRNQNQYNDIDGNIGELYIQSTAMMQRYVDDPVDRNIEFFPTGDLAFFDNNENLHLVGRIRDIINVGGIKVDPAEVEYILLKHPAIQDAAVYSGVSQDNQEIVLAAIVTNQTLSEMDVLSYCHMHTSHYKVPVQLYFLESIPRTASGKCLRLQLPGYHQNKMIFM